MATDMERDSEPARPHPLAPWPTMVERDSGQLPPPEYFDGIPRHLSEPLVAWTRQVLQEMPELALRVALRFRASSPMPAVNTVVGMVSGDTNRVASPRPVDRLAVVDAIVAMHPYWDDAPDVDEYDRRTWLKLVVDLHRLLADAGSAWELNVDWRGLYRRVDSPVVEAWQRARAAAQGSGRPLAGQHLDTAWKLAYGMHPNPSVSYGASVKAVEAVALPIVTANGRRSNTTVHQVRNTLRDKPTEWRFVLVQEDSISAGYGTIEVVAVMLDRLLRGETDRHADDGKNRPSTPEEAQAAVHLAAVLVQWFASGAIQQAGQL